MNPLIAILATAALAFKELIGVQKAEAEQAKKSAKETREAWAETMEAIYSKEPQKKFASRSVQAAKSEVTLEMEPEDETTLGQLAKAPPVGWGVRLGLWIRRKAWQDRLEEIRRTREATARGTFTSALRGSRKVEQRDEDRKKDMEAGRLILDAMREEMTISEKLTSLEAERLYLRDMLKGSFKDEEERGERVVDLARVEVDIAKTKNAYAKENAEWQQKTLELQIKEAEENIRSKMTTAKQFAEYQPGIHELATSWIARRFNWGVWRQANYTEWLEAGAMNQVLAGNVMGARETIFGKAGVRELRAQLEGLGLIKPEQTMENMERHLKELAELAKGDGLSVRADE